MPASIEDGVGEVVPASNEDDGGEVVGIVCIPDNLGQLDQPHAGASNCVCLYNESYMTISQIFDSALGRFNSPVHDTFSDFIV